MREYKGELAGREITLAANFKASYRIAKEIADPLLIARESNLEALMLSRGMTYNPRFSFTVENVPKFIQIGLHEAGEKMDIEKVQEWVFDAGFPAARDLCVEYLGLIIGPQPEEEVETEGESEGN